MKKRPSILIIACDYYLAGIYGRKLERDGWVVEVAESILEGERKVPKIRPDVIVLDTGCCADVAGEVRRLRSLPTTSRVKIAILSSSSKPGEIRGALQAGADTYLLLGHFVPQETVQKLRSLLAS